MTDQTKGSFAGDIDGFFGLLVDNVIQLLVIVALLKHFVGFPDDVLLRMVIPAVGVSVIFGNIFYSMQAFWGAKREGVRKTALPYGINTPSVFAYIFFIMVPVYQTTGDWQKAYAAGIIACLGSGFIEFFGAFIARWIRSVTPRAALLSALAGIALTFISMDFVVRIFTDPLIALVPLTILLAGYYGRAKMPLGLPAGLVAVLVGTALAWVLTYVDRIDGFEWVINDLDNVRRPEVVRQAMGLPQFVVPDPREVWPMIENIFSDRSWLSHLGVIIPMGLFNLVGSLQNLDSAEASGDSYSTAPSLMVNGLGSALGGFLGSCFPTTIYIGHPGWKGMGAGWSYSLLNALAIAALCLTGYVQSLEAIVPITAGAAILLWIGIMMCAQAFGASPRKHGGAVAFGLIPAIAGLIVMIASAPYKPGGIQFTPEAPMVEVQTGANGQDGGMESDGQDPAAIETEETIASEGDSDNEASSPASSPPPPPAYRKTTLQDQLARADRSGSAWAEYPIHGLVRLERGLILISMIWAAITAWIIERRWRLAGAWALAACVLSLLGMIHAYAVNGNDLHFLIPGLEVPRSATRSPAYDFAIAYGAIGLVLVFFGGRGHRVRPIDFASSLPSKAPPAPPPPPPPPAFPEHARPIESRVDVDPDRPITSASATPADTGDLIPLVDVDDDELKSESAEVEKILRELESEQIGHHDEIDVVLDDEDEEQEKNGPKDPR